MPVPYNAWLDTLRRKAALRERAGLRRSVTPRGSAVDLAGNDYLGLSRHPRVLAAAAQALSAYGLGATGSRLVRGTTELHSDLEEALASFIGAERALVYSSGYLANLGAIRALAGLSPHTLLVSDAHCHASMIDGCRLSRAETAVFQHGDVAHAASLLQPGRPTAILTESVFSVDGDLAPLHALHALARSHGALLLVDDAHGLGVTDAVRFLAGEPDVVITATLSKALGGAGGVVAGPAPLIAHLIDTSRTFIFDTALPPAVAAGVLAALDIVRSADDLRAVLHERAATLAALPGSTFAWEDAARPAAASPRPVSPPALSSLAGAEGAVPLPAGSTPGEVYLPGGRNKIDADATNSLRRPERHTTRDAAGHGDAAGPRGDEAGAGGVAAGAGSAGLRGEAGAGDGGAAGSPLAAGSSSAAVKGGALSASGQGPGGGVVSLVAESAQAAWEWASACREKGVAVGCFRPPSTPDGRSRLRLTVNAGVPREDFLHALEVIERCRPSAE